MHLFFLKSLCLAASIAMMTACSSDSGVFSSSPYNPNIYDGINYKGQLNDPIMVITLLSEQQREWSGTPYVLGGSSRRGVDCSGFTQLTFKDRFNISLPRTTAEQVRFGKRVPKEQMQTGDLVFFKTGRGPFGYHVGIYVKDNKFLHASTKGGVIYSAIDSPFWTKTFWQVRRI